MSSAVLEVSAELSAFRDRREPCPLRRLGERAPLGERLGAAPSSAAAAGAAGPPLDMGRGETYTADAFVSLTTLQVSKKEV